MSQPDEPVGKLLLDGRVFIVDALAILERGVPADRARQHGRVHPRVGQITELRVQVVHPIVEGELGESALGHVDLLTAPSPVPLGE